jgi:hypothetical protein
VTSRGVQAERTTLAWFRTRLGLAAVCLLGVRLAADVGTSAMVLALAGFGVASLSLALDHRRHAARLRLLAGEHHEVLLIGREIVLVTLATVVVAGAITVLVVLSW